MIWQVSFASVLTWRKHYRLTGSVAPKPRPRILVPHRDWIVARVTNGQNYTLRGLEAELAERGVKVSNKTVWAFFQARRSQLREDQVYKTEKVVRKLKRSGCLCLAGFVGQ